MNIGHHIKQARIAKGLSQNELAKQIGVSQAAIGQWERGQFTPRGRNLNALRESLDVVFTADQGQEDTKMRNESSVGVAKEDPAQLIMLYGFMVEDLNEPGSCKFMHRNDWWSMETRSRDTRYKIKEWLYTAPLFSPADAQLTTAEKAAARSDSRMQKQLTPYMTSEPLRERVKFARNALAISQDELARRSGLSQSTIAQIETGRNQGTKYAYELAKALTVPVVWLLTGKEK